MVVIDLTTLKVQTSPWPVKAAIISDIMDVVTIPNSLQLGTFFVMHVKCLYVTICHTIDLV